jgi:CDP-glucose 4,6-dehydratase
VTFHNAFEGTKVLVTGHTGFKGTWMTLWLQQLGAEVVGLADGIPTDPAHFVAGGLDATVRTHWIDVVDTEAVTQVIADEAPDFVFHLAAQALVRASYVDPIRTYNVNVLGHANVLEGLRRVSTPCAAVMITSDKCYENVETYHGYREDDRLGGADPYSASKAAAEIIVSSHTRSFFADSSVRIATARAGNVVGGGDWSDDRLVPDVARAWSRGEPVTIRRPQSTRPWQHVLEPLSGYLQLAAELSRNPALHGEAFNFGPPSAAVNTVREVVTALQRHFATLDLTIDETQAHFPEAGLLKLACDKALSLLGWTCVLDFDETMEMTADWYRRFYTDGPDGIGEYSRGQLTDYTTLAAERSLTWSTG